MSGSSLIDGYVGYISSVRRFSPRTCEIYRDCLTRFLSFVMPVADGDVRSPEDPDTVLVRSLLPEKIRRYEAMLINNGISPRTVNLHVSAISGFCRYLVRNGILASNPVRLVKKPKTGKRLPEFYRESDMRTYFRRTEIFVRYPEDLSPSQKPSVKYYDSRYETAVIHSFTSTDITEDHDFLLGLKNRQILISDSLAEKAEESSSDRVLRTKIYAKSKHVEDILAFFSAHTVSYTLSGNSYLVYMTGEQLQNIGNHPVPEDFYLLITEG